MLHVRDPRMLEQPECYHSWRLSFQKDFFDFMSFFEKKTSICYPVEGGHRINMCYHFIKGIISINLFEKRLYEAVTEPLKSLAFKTCLNNCAL